MQSYSVAILGAGVIGSFIFNTLTLKGVKCVLLEKQEDVALGATKANSGIIHAGYDAKPGTLKAKFNVEGAKLIQDIAQRLNVEMQNCGSLVVGKKEDLSKLKELYSRGKQNGVENLQIIEKEELFTLEPNLNKDLCYGLYAKDAKIISPYLLTISLVDEALLNGGQLKLNFDTISIKKDKDNFIITSKDNQKVKAKFLINCTANGVNQIGKMLNEEEIPISFVKGEYILLDKSVYGLVSRPIFPLPSSKGKGILACPTVHHNTFFGPTAVSVEDYDTSFSYDSLHTIKEKVGNMVDKIDFRKTIKLYAGVRVISGDDFVVKLENKTPNYIVLAGICSPGLSGAPAIANYVADYVLSKGVKSRKVKLKKLKPIPKISQLDKANQNLYINSENGNYGEIVCNCEKITKGEILQVLKNTRYRLTTDGIKRRLRVTMGHCGGSFCYPKLLKIMADYYKVDQSQIVARGQSSLVVGDIKEGGIYDK